VSKLLRNKSSGLEEEEEEKRKKGEMNFLATLCCQLNLEDGKMTSISLSCCVGK
jgi:hypothetical protein